MDTIIIRGYTDTDYIVCIWTGAYAGFLRGGPNFKISGILDIHAASSEAASLC